MRIKPPGRAYGCFRPSPGLRTLVCEPSATISGVASSEPMYHREHRRSVAPNASQAPREFPGRLFNTRVPDAEFRRSPPPTPSPSIQMGGDSRLRPPHSPGSDESRRAGDADPRLGPCDYGALRGPDPRAYSGEGVAFDLARDGQGDRGPRDRVSDAGESHIVTPGASDGDTGDGASGAPGVAGLDDASRGGRCLGEEETAVPGEDAAAVPRHDGVRRSPRRRASPPGESKGNARETVDGGGLRQGGHDGRGKVGGEEAVGGPKGSAGTPRGAPIRGPVEADDGVGPGAAGGSSAGVADAGGEAQGGAIAATGPETTDGPPRAWLSRRVRTRRFGIP